jgi:sulfite reductase alpha subunit-like flavoprotein
LLRQPTKNAVYFSIRNPHNGVDQQTTTTMTEARKEKVYVLYGSQTGNSEQAAKDFCDQVSTKLSPAMIQKFNSSRSKETMHQIPVVVEPIHMQLDDFLELERCKWTRLTVIFTSSYGVGQAPLGCYRFRDLCDAWHDQYGSRTTKNNNNNNSADDAKTETTNNSKILDGLYFAMCGLGDSKYTTYFQNPTKIHDALQLVGATRVGPLGRADASGTGDALQSTVIEQWIHGIWPHLAAVLVQEPPSTERLAKIEQATVQLCAKINPDFELEKEKDPQKAFLNKNVFVQVLIVLVAIGFYYYFSVYPTTPKLGV